MHDNDFGKLILRVMIASLMLFHGYAKIKYGIDFLEGLMKNNGLPSLIAYLVFLGEILAPIMLIIGYKTRFAATIIIFTMLTAIYLVHMDDLTALTKVGSLKLESIYFFIFSSFALIFLGPGRYSFDRN